MSVMQGDPETFAPELFCRLSPLERSQVRTSFAWRASIIGTGKERYPDDEEAASVARRAFVLGVGNFGARALAFAAFLAAFCFSLLPDPWSMRGAICFWGLSAVVLVLWLVRWFQIRSFFRELTDTRAE